MSQGIGGDPGRNGNYYTAAAERSGFAQINAKVWRMACMLVTAVTTILLYLRPGPWTRESRCEEREEEDAFAEAMGDEKGREKLKLVGVRPGL